MAGGTKMENMERLKGKTILVTGGAGFIGGHVVELLLSKNCKVIVVDIQKPGITYFFLRKLNEKVDYRCIDITHEKSVLSLFSDVHPDYVIHLAALPIVEEAYETPRKAFQVNIMGTVNILEACRKGKDIKGIIVASSDKAYGKMKETYTEDSPLQGDHPYDVSKSCEDLIAQTYHATYELPIVVTRFGNVYGEGDMHFDRIIPGICKAVATGKTLSVRSDGTYIRDYIYVKDVAKGYLFLLENILGIEGQAFNFSSDDMYSVLQLIEVAQRCLGVNIQYKILNAAKNEIPYQHLNDSKIRARGWKNQSTIRSSLKNTFLWYQMIIPLLSNRA